MNLYNWLKFDTPFNWSALFKDENQHVMNKKQHDFCDQLMKDVPEICGWNVSPCIIGGVRQPEVIKLFKCDSGVYTNPELGRIAVGVTGIKDYDSWMNIFQIQDQPILDWTPPWDSVHNGLYQFCYDKDADLRIIVRDWLIEYERKIQRKYKLLRCMSLNY